MFVVCKWVMEYVGVCFIFFVGNFVGVLIVGFVIDEVVEVVGYVVLGYLFGMLVLVLFG